jgi:biotin transport system substrate-specific component
MNDFSATLTFGKRELITGKTACKIIGFLLFLICTSLGAFVRIPLPFTPVPITLQTFFVVLSAAFLGANLGCLAQITYLFLGSLGLPIFAGATYGLGVLFGPTGGYLLAFVLANLFIGQSLNRGRQVKYSRVLLTMILAALFIDGLGTLWLAGLMKISLTKALFLGFLPFVPADLAKSIGAAAIYCRIQSRTRQIFF